MKKVYRSKENKVWAGVIAGVGEYFGIDPTLLRLLWLLIVVCTGFFPGLIAYLIAIAIVPKKD